MSTVHGTQWPRQNSREDRSHNRRNLTGGSVTSLRRPEPLEERKRRLAELVATLGNPALQSTDGIIGEGRALFEVVKARGMEGIVAKRLGSPYAPGRRTGAWVKVKVPGYASGRREWFEHLTRPRPGREHAENNSESEWEGSMSQNEVSLPERLPDNWRRIIHDNCHSPARSAAHRAVAPRCSLLHSG